MLPFGVLMDTAKMKILFLEKYFMEHLISKILLLFKYTLTCIDQSNNQNKYPLLNSFWDRYLTVVLGKVGVWRTYIKYKKFFKLSVFIIFLFIDGLENR